MNLLVRSPNWLGDAVMAIPALTALRRGLGPSATIDVLTPAKLTALWETVPGVNAVLTTDPNIAITADSIRRRHYHAALLFPHSLRAALEVTMAGIPRRIGFAGHSRRWLLTDIVPGHDRRSGIRHQALDGLDLAAHVPDGLPETACSGLFPFPAITCPLPRPMPSASAWLAVCPGAEYGPAKRWPAQRFAQAASTLARQNHWEVILLGAESDLPVCADVACHLQVPHRNLAGQTTLREFLAWLGHAACVLCNDSGAMHVAALYGRRGAAIFGSTEPRLTGPITPTMHIIRRHVPCSPCFLRVCPIDFRCMDQVSVDNVLAAL